MLNVYWKQLGANKSHLPREVSSDRHWIPFKAQTQWTSPRWVIYQSVSGGAISQDPHQSISLSSFNSCQLARHESNTNPEYLRVVIIDPRTFGLTKTQMEHLSSPKTFPGLITQTRDIIKLVLILDPVAITTKLDDT